MTAKFIQKNYFKSSKLEVNRLVFCNSRVGLGFWNV